jgi:hypothetical protein
MFTLISYDICISALILGVGNRTSCSQSAPMVFMPPLKKPHITLEVSLKSLDQTLGELAEIYMFESVLLQPPKAFLRLKIACKSFVLG